MQLNGFDATKVDPRGTFEPLPADWYEVVITASEEKPTKAQTGSFLELKLEVVDGQYKGRLLFDRLNLNNPNKIAEEIAASTLSAICHAVGVMNPEDSSELHDRPLMVKVVVKPADGAYSASNEVKGYDGVNGKSAGTATKPAASFLSIPASRAAASTPPWKR